MCVEKGFDVLWKRQAEEGAADGMDQAQRLPRVHHVVPACRAGCLQLQAEKGVLLWSSLEDVVVVVIFW